jgi:hypothetical protein
LKNKSLVLYFFSAALSFTSVYSLATWKDLIVPARLQRGKTTTYTREKVYFFCRRR